MGASTEAMLREGVDQGMKQDKRRMNSNSIRDKNIFNHFFYMNLK